MPYPNAKPFTSSEKDRRNRMARMRNRRKTLLKKASELAEEGVGIHLHIEYRGKIHDFAAAEPSPPQNAKLPNKAKVHDDCKAKESTTQTN